MQTLTANLEAAAKVVKGKAWGVDIQKPRIYMWTNRRDAKVFFDFPNADYTRGNLGAPILKVQLAECGQSPKWYGSQKKIIAGNFKSHAKAIREWLKSVVQVETN